MAIAKKYSTQPSISPSEGAVLAPESSSDSQHRSRWPQSWQWLLIGFNLCVSAGAIAVGCLLWIISLPPAPDCQQLPAIAPDSERLFCAQQAAQSGQSADLLAALDLVEPWGENHPLYLQKQQQLERWSEAILKLAYQQAYDSDLDTAIGLARRIPPSSSVYEKAQSTIREWRTEWHRGEKVYAEAQIALQAKDWDKAQAQVKQLSTFSHPHWRSHQAQTLAQQVTVERQAHTVATQVQGWAALGTIRDIQNAIIKARTMDRTTYTWKSLQPELNQWHETLLQQGLTLWYEGHLDQSISLADVVAVHPEFKTEADDLKILNQARKRAVQSAPVWEPTISHLWHLTQAIEIASKIKPDSRFYPQAASSLESWEQQRVDLQQLHYAQLAAQTRTKSGYQYAIEQAQHIAGDRPRRLQAQTLIAHWQREIERIEDRPHLVAAQQLAASGTTADLRRAIARAQDIAPSRLLYSEAQSLIDGWRSDIQTIEDRPILTQARQLADEGNFQDAITTASRIGAGRSLYSQAQNLTQRWRQELRERQQIVDGFNDKPEDEKDPTDFVQPDSVQPNFVQPNFVQPELVQPTPNDEFPPEFSPMTRPDSPTPEIEPQGQQEPEQVDIPVPPGSSSNSQSGRLESPPAAPLETSRESSSSHSPSNSETGHSDAEHSSPQGHNSILPETPPIPPIPNLESSTSTYSVSDDSSGMTQPESVIPPGQTRASETFEPVFQTHQPFDLHSELSQDTFPLLFAGALFMNA